MSSKKIVLSVEEWDTSSVVYGAPKVNDKGGKSIAITSKQTNRLLHVTTPLLMTWGISDFVDEKTGQSDGKYSISLNFPNDDYRTEVTDMFLEKLKAFENQILDDAVKNSEKWWGKKMTREICEYSYFPFLKYSKNKDTKEVDYTKPPSIRAKVPNYGGKWGVEIYDTNSRMIFPCDNENITPIELVPKLSRVACGLQCTGVWIGGKGWGVTWKMFQCIVKPRELVSAYGKCHIQLSKDEKQEMEKQEIPDDAVVAAVETTLMDQVATTKPAVAAPSTYAEDSDHEDEVPPPVQPDVVEAATTAVAESSSEVAPLFKKVVKKPVAAAPVEEDAAPKKVVKKVVKKAV